MISYNKNYYTNIDDLFFSPLQILYDSGFHFGRPE